jgi:tRNA-specific 2-thiouridylase
MKVVVGLSGGVDSSVAAWLLKEQGHEVEGLFMVNWHDTVGVLAGDCPAEHDRLLAQLVAKKLQIPLHEIDLSEEYRRKVVEYMFNEYEKGRTPNPDILCNREIKFGPFLEIAKQHGADYIATGHYCRKETIEKDGKTYYRLLAGTDKNKDQSYFLCQLSQEQLVDVLFPIGHLEKPEVRRIAHKLGLPTADRKDSQGICFVGKIDLPVFLQQQLQSKQGDIIEIVPPSPPWKEDVTLLRKKVRRPLWEKQGEGYQPADGKVIGTHRGAHFYTIGQRKGLNVGGKKEPLFVIGTDVEKNIVYVGMGQQHKELYRNELFIRKDDIHWVRPDLAMQASESRKYFVRIRDRQP